MASVKLVTNGKGTTVRTVVLPLGISSRHVDAAATALETIICEEKSILHVEVEYEGCDDSKTI